MRGRPFSSSINVNDTVDGKVLRLAGFGAFVEMAEGVEGLVPFFRSAGLDRAQIRPGAADPGAGNGLQNHPDE